MKAGFPSDGIFKFMDSPFKAEGEQLQGVDIHMLYLDDPFLNSFHKSSVMRIWGLMIERMSGRLLSFSSNPNIYERMNEPSLTIEKFQKINIYDNKKVVYLVNPTDDGFSNLLTNNSPPPRGYIFDKGFSVSILSKARLDFDLKLKLDSKSEQLSYKNPVTKFGRWAKDEDGNESITILHGVEFDIRKLIVELEVDSKHSPKRIPSSASGTIQVSVDDGIYAYGFQMTSKQSVKASTWLIHKRHQVDILDILGM